jgi:hypothetical protein
MMLGLPTKKRTATMNRIEITQVVKIEFVTGIPKSSVKLYGDGLTPSAAFSAGAIPESKKTVGSNLFTKN